jgi:hypothetical protein
MATLINVRRSWLPTKKFVAYFKLFNGTRKTVHFGAQGADDYTITGDLRQRNRYRARHHHDLVTRDPTKAGFLSYYILWGDSTNIHTNIRTFKERFNV